MAYVEIEKVLETARNGYHSDFGRSIADLTSLQEVLEDTPTADVEEVKHGQWELHNDGSGTCSHCKTRQKHIWYFDNMQNYCGHCGARMNVEGCATAHE